jgi:rhodanese-related sulfurtransferase
MSSDQLLEFAGNHPLLMMALLVVCVLVVANEVTTLLKAGMKISPQEAVLKYNRDEAVFLDTRSHNDFAAAHIVGAIHYPAANASERLATLSKYKTKTLIYYSQSGADPHAIGRLLKKEGFETIFELEGGYDGWLAQSMPVEASRKKK